MAFDFSAWEIPRRSLGANDLDAKACRTTPAQVADFKRRQGLPGDERLSEAAHALLLVELEAAQRAAKGEQCARAQALSTIAQRTTTEMAQAIAAAVPFPAQLSREAGIYVWGSQIDAYLLNRVEALTGKGYATTAAAHRKAASLAPAAASAADALRTRGGTVTRPSHCDRSRLAWFWGVVLRLDQLEGLPPADPLAFYRWSQLDAYESQPTPLDGLGDLLSGRMGEQEARTLLQLPVAGPLEGAAIRSAYRAQARTAHPDAGGDRHRFERLSAARDRLLAAAVGVG